ncbi:MAG TPA: hypothetical protein VG204_14470 [Terriglobia bacterium]|nr:hypothetical protein [Terriglobia bacterium]
MADFTWLQTLWTYEPDRNKKPHREPLKVAVRVTRTTEQLPKRSTQRSQGPSKN